MARVTPEERKAIFAEVQGRSARQKEKRRLANRKMAKSYSDSVTIPDEPEQKQMSSGTPDIAKEGLIDSIKRRKRALQESMK